MATQDNDAGPQTGTPGDAATNTRHSALGTRHFVGCLLLHGLTSSLATVSNLVPYLEARGIPYAMPTLRGHGTRPEDLRGVTWRDWYGDAERALDELLGRCDRAVIMGLSMGGVVALQLASQRQERLAGVVTVAAALQLQVAGRLLLPLLARVNQLAAVDVRKAFADQSLVASATNYPRAPISAVAALAAFGKLVERELPRIRVPLLTIYTPQDRVVVPAKALVIHERAGTPPDRKRLLAFPNSGHEMLMDRDRAAVCEAIVAFIEECAAGDAVAKM
jgi:carboxylesterase